MNIIKEMCIRDSYPPAFSEIIEQLLVKKLIPTSFTIYKNSSHIEEMGFTSTSFCHYLVSWNYNWVQLKNYGFHFGIKKFNSEFKNSWITLLICLLKQIITDKIQTINCFENSIFKLKYYS